MNLEKGTVGATPGQQTVASTTGPERGSPTVTDKSVTTRTMYTSTTASLKDLYALNASAVSEVVDEYIDERISQLNEIINSRTLQETYATWHDLLTLWNETTYSIFDAKKAGYNDLLDFQNKIELNLAGQSSRINQTLDELSRTALTVGPGNGQDYVKNLTIDYWFVSGLVEGVSEKLQTLQTIYKEIELPTFTNSSFSFTSENVSDSLKGLKTNLTVDLQNIIPDQSVSKANDAQRSLFKRSGSRTENDKRLYKRSCQLTIAICVSYAAAVILLCIYEWFKFSWQRDMFNLHTSDAFETSDIEHELETVKIRLQQRLRSFSRDLAFSLSEAAVYKFWNCLRRMRDGSDSHWKRVSLSCWWIWSNGKILWILILCTLLHWQILLSMIHAQRGSLEAGSPSVAVSKSATSNLDTNTTEDASSIYSQVSWTCSNFETDINVLLASQATLELRDFLGEPVNEINSKMTDLVANVSHVTQVPWENLTNSIEASAISSNSSLTFSVIAKAIKQNVTGTPAQTQLSKIRKRAQEGLKDHDSPKLTSKIYKASLIALAITALIHHLFGFLVLYRL